MESMVDIAKQNPRMFSKQFWLGKLDERASELRTAGLSHQQSYSRMLDSDPIGKAYYQASKVAAFKHADEFEAVQKAQADAVGASLSATERLSKLCLAFKASKPDMAMSDDELCEYIIKRNPELAAEFRRENGLAPIQKAAASPLGRFGRIAESLVRLAMSIRHDEAARRVAATHPALTARAKAESDPLQAEEGDCEVGKGGIRVSKGAAQHDAMGRLKNITVRLITENAYQPDSAWAVVLARNPKLAQRPGGDKKLAAIKQIVDRHASYTRSMHCRSRAEITLLYRK